MFQQKHSIIKTKNSFKFLFHSSSFRQNETEIIFLLVIVLTSLISCNLKKIDNYDERSLVNDKVNNISTNNDSFSSDSERWDARHYTYSNYTYGFGWDLPKVYEWKKVDGQEKHTVFRAEGFPFFVFVNAKETNIKDLWSIYCWYIDSIEHADITIEKKTGMISYERTFEKCILLGQHAIKTTYYIYFKDSRHNEPIEIYKEAYIVPMNDYLFIIAVNLPKSVHDEYYDCDEAISEIFKGFRFAKQQ